MAVTIRPVRFKVTQEWEQKTRIGRYGTYFDRDFFISKKAFGFGLGNLNFNVKFKTDRSNDPYVIVETESKEIFIDFRILVEYSAGGKSGCFTSNPKKDLLCKFTSDCPNDKIFNEVFKSNVELEINVAYKVTFELELKKTEMPPLKPNLLHKLYSEGEFSDVKIHCDGKVFNCHKLILSGQSQVFKNMLVENDFIESSSGKIEITDISATAMENLLFFIYHEDLDGTKITGDLLVVANKYDVSDLVNYCVEFLGGNLSENNAVDVMTSAFLTDQEELFELAYKFIFFKLRIKDQMVETEAWKKLQEEKPVLALKMLNKAVFRL